MSKTASLDTFIAQLEAASTQYENPSAFWECCGLAFRIWRSGGLPAAHWDPRHNQTLMPLFKGLQKHGDALVAAVDARVFA